MSSSRVVRRGSHGRGGRVAGKNREQSDEETGLLYRNGAWGASGQPQKETREVSRFQLSPAAKNEYYSSLDDEMVGDQARGGAWPCSPRSSTRACWPGEGIAGSPCTTRARSAHWEVAVDGLGLVPSRMCGDLLGEGGIPRNDWVDDPGGGHQDVTA